MDEGGFEPPRANTAVLKTAPLDLTRAPILLQNEFFINGWGGIWTPECEHSRS